MVWAGVGQEQTPRSTASHIRFQILISPNLPGQSSIHLVDIRVILG